MIVLGVETSTARSSVAVLADGDVVAHLAHEDARGHGAFLAPAMRRCLDAAPGDPTAVAVGTGPGLYTGLRVGMATAGAFASARGLPLVGVGGMDALALGCGVDDATVVTTLDARRGQVFWAVHGPGGPGMHCIEEPRVGTREELEQVVARLAVAGSVRVVGEVASEAVRRPDAADTARLAVRALSNGPADRPDAAAMSPVYLRDADVRIGWDERGGARGGAGADHR